MIAGKWTEKISGEKLLLAICPIKTINSSRAVLLLIDNAESFCESVRYLET